MNDLIPRPNTSAVSHLTGNMELLAIARRIRERTAQFVYETGCDLIKAKGTCRHGEWLTFLRHVEIPPRAAQRMMRYARLRDLRPYRRIRERALSLEGRNGIDPPAVVKYPSGGNYPTEDNFLKNKLQSLFFRKLALAHTFNRRQQ